MSVEELSLNAHCFQIGRTERAETVAKFARELVRMAKDGKDPVPNILIEVLGEL